MKSVSNRKSRSAIFGIKICENLQQKLEGILRWIQHNEKYIRRTLLMDSVKYTEDILFSMNLRYRRKHPT